jgi:hypothetical protein
MALIDVLNHSDKVTPGRRRAKLKKRGRTKGWRKASKTWMRQVTRDPLSYYKESPPENVTGAGYPSRQGRSLKSWIAGIVRKELVVGVASVRKRIRKESGSQCWSKPFTWRFNREVERACRTGGCCQIDGFLVSSRVAAQWSRSTP